MVGTLVVSASVNTLFLCRKYVYFRGEFQLAGSVDMQAIYNTEDKLYIL